ncbi:hypothetical protein D3C73_1311610 [compost metagenome]
MASPSRARLQTTMFTLARCAQVISLYLASPVIREVTAMPALFISFSMSHISPAMLYSPIRLTPSGVCGSGSPVPITYCSRASPASRLPRFLLPTKPGLLTGMTGSPSRSPASLQTASISSPISAVTQVEYTNIAGGAKRPAI